MGYTSMQLATALTRETPRGRFMEFATLGEDTITQTQIELRDGRVYMRAKRRTVAFFERTE